MEKRKQSHQLNNTGGIKMNKNNSWNGRNVAHRKGMFGKEITV